jgi:hypothetical protein
MEVRFEIGKIVLKKYTKDTSLKDTISLSITKEIMKY